MMSMAHRSAARPRPAVDAAPRIHVVPMDTTREGGGITALLEGATQEILAGTYWVDPAPNPRAGPLPLRPGAGDPSRHLGSVSDAGHRCHLCTSVPGDCQ